jgi:hypothetical protein
MAYVEGTLGAMLQGVSQQPARLRAEGQVTEQVNYESDVSTGLTSRPGTEVVATLMGSQAGMALTPVDFNGAPYLVGHADGYLQVWDINGVQYTMDFPDGTDYASTDMVFRADESAKHVKCLSRGVTVAMSGTVDGRPLHAAVATVLGGLYDRTYTVTLVADNGDEQTVSYTTPDGTTSGDGTKTSAGNIATEIKNAWDALTLPAGFAGVTLEQHENTLLWTAPTAVVISADDDEGGDTIRVADDVVKDATHLPRTSKHGHTVLVQGGRSEDDDYFLRFDSDVTSADGAGFGSPGVWRETADPDLDNDLNRLTLPFALEIDPVTSTAIFRRVFWRPRRAGGEDTNETPPFVGSTIRDMVIFEGRLLVLSDGAVYGSRAGDTRDFWKKSATTQTDDDPLSFRSTAANGATLDWIVPFDRDLLIVSDPGSAQFVIRGGGLTPRNASMVLTTEYEVDSGVRPVSTGRTVILPFRQGGFVGINEFFTRDEVSTNAADPLTAVQPRYIQGKVRGLAAATNFNQFTILTGQPRSMWVYRYLWDATQRLQSAWYKFRFSDKIGTHFYDASYMYVVFKDDYNPAVLTRMDMNRVPHPDAGFHVTMDRIETLTVGIGSTVDVPYSGAQVLQGSGCQSPGLQAAVMGTTDIGGGFERIQLDAVVCPPASTVVVGKPIERTLEPTMPQPKNGAGTVTSVATLNIRHFMLHMDDSPDVKATRASVYRDKRDFFPRRVPMSNDPLDPDEGGTRDYVMKVPWRETHDRSNLTITCDDIRPDTILEVEWAGDLRGVRRRI